MKKAVNFFKKFIETKTQLDNQLGNFSIVRVKVHLKQACRELGIFL